MVKLGRDLPPLRLAPPRSHVRAIPLPYDWAKEADAFNPRESVRLKRFFDAIPTFQLLPDEDTPCGS